MKERPITLLAALAAALAGLAALGWWLTREPAADLLPAVPGMDGRPSAAAMAKAAATGGVEVVRIGEIFQRLDGKASGLPGAWPRFRGPDGDNISREPVPLADAWGTNGPQVLWSVDLGEGYAAPAVLNGRAYLLDYDEAKKADLLRCLSLDDGRDIWRRGYHLQAKRNHGISRTVPAVTDKHVVTLGPRCHVMCVDAVTGDLRWGLDLERDYGTKVPLWYAGQCPLIDGEVAVLAPGGKSLLMGVDCASGATVWSTPNPDGWNMSHSSVVIAVIGGRRVYLYCAVEGMVAVAADGADRGRALWTTREWARNVIAPSPVAVGGDRLFVTAGYSAGSALLQVAADGGRATVSVLQRWRPDEGLASEQQTPVLYNGRVYGILPKDGGALRNELACYDPADCRRVLWSSGKEDRYGLGPYLVADGKLLVLGDEGELTMFRIKPDGCERLARAKVLNGVDAWGPMALAGGRLLVRDSRRMVCLDMVRR